MIDRRLFHVHIMRTAGIALRQRLRHCLGDRVVYPDVVDGRDVYESIISVDRLLRRFHERGHEIRAVSGHFPLCTVSLLPAQFTTSTVLRHPVERTLSYLRHRREVLGGGRGMTLERVYADQRRFHALVHNHMVKMYSLTVDEMTTGALTAVRFTRERLARAMENLARIDVVGLQEDFGGFCELLGRRLGLDLGWNVRANESPLADDTPQRLQDRILEDNQADLELYEFARRLVADRARAGSAAVSVPAAEGSGV